MDRVPASAPTSEASEHRIALGERLRSLRRIAKLTIRDVAGRAGVDKNTVLNVEMGRSVRDSSLSKVCQVFGLFANPQVVHAQPSESGSHYAVHHSRDAEWYRITLDNVKAPSVIATSNLVQDASARQRLGTSGLAQQFIQRLTCQLPNGKIRAALLEVYGPSGWSHQLGGEAFFYCLRGSVRFRLRGESFVLQSNSAATIDRTVEHMHEPEQPLKQGELPPLLLYVQVD